MTCTQRSSLFDFETLNPKLLSLSLPPSLSTMAESKTESDPSKKSKKKKRLKSLLSATDAVNKKSFKQEPKHSDFISVRKKFDALGRKQKGEDRPLGVSRSLAIEKRRKTLEKEYEQSTKSSVFIDRRIGEKDDTLQEFDKAVMRLQRVRQSKSRKGSRYNLDDDEEIEYDPFTDDFDEEVPLDDDDDDDDDALDQDGSGSKYLSFHETHHSTESTADDGVENAHKSKKQVMSEIILKSKFHKAQKAKDKEEDDHLLEKLDEDFISMVQNQALVSLTQPGKMNTLIALANKSVNSQPSKVVLSSSAENGSMLKEKPDEYDKLVKELSLDTRARPSDRTKTPEEIAQEERERLESLEEERQKRMLGTDDSSDEDDSVGDGNDSQSKAFRPVSGDDLGDSFSADTKSTDKKGWVDDIYENDDAGDKDEGGTGSEGSDDEDDQEESVDEDEEERNDEADSGDELRKMSMKDWEQSDDDAVFGEAEQSDDDYVGVEAEQSNDADEVGNIRKKMKTESLGSRELSSEKKIVVQQETLPYVIDVPNNLAELCSLIDGRSDGEVIEAIYRIWKCNTIRLSKENIHKMMRFYGIIVQYFAVLAAESPLNIIRLSSLVKPLIELTAETPRFTAVVAKRRLEHIRTKFCGDIKNPEKSSWPSLKTLLLLRLWSLIFPCSDFRHIVMTPAILLMCEYLMRCPIITGRDVSVGLFLCSLVLNVFKQSQKFCPEAIIFLQTLLISSLKSESRLQYSQCHHLMELKTSKQWLLIQNKTDEVHPVDFFKVMGMEADSSFFLSDNFKASTLLTVVETVKGFVSISEKLSSFPEIFMPISDLLHQVLLNANLPNLIQRNINDVVDLIKRKSNELQVLRQPLQMRKEKPVPIKLLNPKFEEGFVKGRDYDPDKERAEIRKLWKLVKKERKGAIREMLKDNHHIHGLKEKDRLLQEEGKAEKYGKAMAFLQAQEHAFKSGQLGKSRKRRR